MGPVDLTAAGHPVAPPAGPPRAAALVDDAERAVPVTRTRIEFDVLGVRVPLEAADADVAVAEPDEHGGAGRRRLVAALERLARLDQREAA